MLKSYKFCTAHSIEYLYQISGRKFASKSEASKKITRIRSAQKKLYGGIIRSEKTVPTVGGDDDYGEQNREKNIRPSKICNESNVTHPDISNEFYWLVGRYQQSKNIKVFKKLYRQTDIPKQQDRNEETKSTPAEATGQVEKNTYDCSEGDSSSNIAHSSSTASTPKPIQSAKNFLRGFILGPPRAVHNSIQQPSSIPFDDDGLKSILSYPLDCAKASTDQVNEVIGDTSIRLPSISKVLQVTMSESARFALKRWKLAKIAELGEAGFREYEQKTLQTGTQFHSAIQNYFDRQEVPDASSPVLKLWQSVDGVLVELAPKPILIEKPIVHPDLKYKGIIDCVSIVRDTMCALEWKTSEKVKSQLQSTYDAPVQLCAYLGALNIDSRYSMQAKNGYVVIAYKNGDAAHSFYLSEADVRKYWTLWLKRLQEFWIRTSDGTIPEPI